MFIMVLIMMATAYVEKSKFGIIFELTYVYYPLFRGLILATVFVALYGFDVYVWKHSGLLQLKIEAQHGLPGIPFDAQRDLPVQDRSTAWLTGYNSISNSVGYVVHPV